jgi:ABC-2 type transport system permease protein
MTSDIATIMWKEWRELLRMSGKRRGAMRRMIISVGLLGVIWPWQIGASFVLSASAALFAAFTAAMHTAGVVPDSFAGERERHTLETLLASRLPDRAILFGKVFALILYGLGTAAIMLAFAVVTVNVTHSEGHLMFYSPSTIMKALISSVVASGFVGAIGVLVSLRAATVKQAQQVLSTAVLLFLFLPVIALPALPPSWRVFGVHMVQKYGARTIFLAACAALITVQLILYAIVLARFKRARLIVEQ